MVVGSSRRVKGGSIFKQLEDKDDDFLRCAVSSATLHGPLLDTQQLVVAHHRTEKFHTVFENLLHELP